ncbi:peptidase M48 family protein [Pleurotus pulmonarius]
MERWLNSKRRIADVIGLRLMSKMCYDPSAAPRLVSSLALSSSHLAEFESKSQRVRLEFLQTHPLTERRVEAKCQLAHNMEWRVKLREKRAMIIVESTT